MPRINFTLIFLVLLLFSMQKNVYSEPLEKPSYKIDIGNKGKCEFNKALEIENLSSPVFFIFVTRKNNNLPIDPNDWDKIKKVLEDICKDTAGTTHLTTFHAYHGYKDLDDYIKDHMQTIRNSCKIVIFNETIAGKQTLAKAEYDTFKGDLIALSNSCKKAIFYQNFLYEEPYDAMNFSHAESLRRYNSITSAILGGLNEFIAPGGMVSTQGAEVILLKLANSLRSVGGGGSPALNALSADLGFLGVPADMRALADLIAPPVIPPNPITIAAVATDALKAHGAALKFHNLLTGAASVLATPGQPAAELAKIAKLATLMASSGITGEIAGTVATLMNFQPIKNSLYNIVNQNRIQSQSIMIPIFAPSHIIKNATQSIYDGHILTEYRKRAYFCEDDDRIGLNKATGLQGFIFDFGIGRDIAVHLSGASPKHQSVQNALLRNIGVEICYDLANGIRHSNGWNNLNKQSNFLILQSNTIDPTGRTYPSANVNHLPKSCCEQEILILHSDASKDSPSGSHMFKISNSGAPILFENEKINRQNALINLPNDITITLYKLN